jgi:uncharacterized protein (DUF58 family)
VTFPLVPRGRLIGLSFGTMRSFRRGTGSDVVDSRPYRTGDDVHSIDWAASARRSAALNSDEFIVREHYADEAPRVVVLSDRRPSMSIFPEGWPWLSKPDAIRNAVTLIGSSATAARGLLGYFDEADGDPYWHPPRSTHTYGAPELERGFGAPEDTLRRGLRHLAEHKRDLPAGTFVFIVSDFLEVPTRDEWLDALERRYELVPVIVQDPIWEQSFPPVDGIVVPLAGADGRVRLVRLKGGESEERRRAHVQRRDALLEEFAGLGIEPVLLSSSDHEHVLAALMEWAANREFDHGRGWR